MFSERFDRVSKMDLFNLNELTCPLITIKCTATGENIHVETILKKKTSISKFHL